MRDLNKMLVRTPIELFPDISVISTVADLEYDFDHYELTGGEVIYALDLLAEVQTQKYASTIKRVELGLKLRPKDLEVLLKLRDTKVVKDAVDALVRVNGLIISDEYLEDVRALEDPAYDYLEDCLAAIPASYVRHSEDSDVVEESMDSFAETLLSIIKEGIYKNHEKAEKEKGDF